MQTSCVYVLVLAAAGGGASAQEWNAAASAPAAGATPWPEIVVLGQLDEARQRIVPSLGATVYTIDAPEIADLTEGDNVPFGKLALRLPGVSQDSEGSGNFHIRDDHGNVQYRIDDVLIPEGITGFSEDFDTRFAQDVELITGALPAQYGFRTSGILDIHTKSGATAPGGEVEMYGGSNGEVRPSFEYGGSQGRWNFYFSGSYLRDNLGRGGGGCLLQAGDEPDRRRPVRRGADPERVQLRDGADLRGGVEPEFRAWPGCGLREPGGGGGLGRTGELGPGGALRRGAG
jgi:hypothetical protein